MPVFQHRRHHGMILAYLQGDMISAAAKHAESSVAHVYQEPIGKEAPVGTVLIFALLELMSIFFGL